MQHFNKAITPVSLNSFPRNSVGIIANCNITLTPSTYHLVKFFIRVIYNLYVILKSKSAVHYGNWVVQDRRASLKNQIMSRYFEIHLEGKHSMVRLQVPFDANFR